MSLLDDVLEFFKGKPEKQPEKVSDSSTSPVTPYRPGLTDTSEKNSYEKFLDKLANHESLGRRGYHADNGSYWGKYQLGKAALIDAGYIRKNGAWAGIKGVHNKEDFKHNPEAQEDAIRQYHEKVWSYIKAAHLNKHSGDVINDVELTKLGMLAGAHLVGVGGLKEYINSCGKIVPCDANDTPISKYIKDMAGSDEIPLEKSGDQPNHPLLSAGMKGAEVKTLQAQLNRLGASPPLPEDGDFGEKTKDAVKKFQEEHRLIQDGKMGPKTWNALDKALKELALATPLKGWETALAQATSPDPHFQGTSVGYGASIEAGKAPRIG